MKKTTVSLFAVTLALSLGASAGAFSVEPEGPLPVIKKEGARVFMDGYLNGMSDWYARYVTMWVRQSSELKDFKFFKTFSIYGGVGLSTVLNNVKPDVVISVCGVEAIHYGVADEQLKKFRSGWEKTADAYKKAGITWVLMSMPARYGSKPESEQNKKLAVHADALRAFAKERGLCYFDLHRASFEFIPKHTAACINDLRMAKLLLDLMGIEVVSPHLAVDYAAGTATVDAPSTVVAKGKGTFELTCPRPPLGYTFCDMEAAQWTGLEIKVANLPADCEKVRIVWKGHDATVPRADLEKGINIKRVAPGWSPFRDVGMRAMWDGGVDLGWNTLTLTERLPSFERAVKKMDPAHDRTAFYEMLRREIHDGVNRQYENAERKTASHACGPTTVQLAFTPVKAK